MKISVSKLENVLSNAGVNYIDLINDRNPKWTTAISTIATSPKTISTRVLWVKKAVTTVAWVRKAVTTKVLWS